jgi:hypothetical protein
VASGEWRVVSGEARLLHAGVAARLEQFIQDQIGRVFILCQKGEFLLQHGLKVLVSLASGSLFGWEGVRVKNRLPYDLGDTSVGFNGSFPKTCQHVVRSVPDGDEIHFDRVEFADVAYVVSFEERPPDALFRLDRGWLRDRLRKVLWPAVRP